MADRGPFSNKDVPRQSSGYGNVGYRNTGYGNNGYGNNSGYENSVYGNAGCGNTGYANTTAYGNTTGYGSSGHGNNNNNNNSGYGNSGYGNDNFDRRGSMDVRKPQQPNAHRMRNNRGSSTWQRGPVAPSMSWREQGRPAELGSRNSYHNPEYVQADVAGRRPYAAGQRPKTPELASAYAAGPRPKNPELASPRPKTPELTSRPSFGPRPKSPGLASHQRKAPELTSRSSFGSRPQTPELASPRQNLSELTNRHSFGRRPKTPELPSPRQNPSELTNRHSFGRRPKTPELASPRQKAPELTSRSSFGSRPQTPELASPRQKTPELTSRYSFGQRSKPSELASRNSMPQRLKMPELASSYSASPRPMTPEVAPSRKNGAAPLRALAAYADVGGETDGHFGTSIVGTCQDMCPAREREQRQRLRDLAIFERINGNMARTSATLAVKKFCRTITVAELEPSDVRPQNVLWGTLQYLMHMLDRRDYSFEAVHAFLFDRTRAVRQELGMQCIANNQAITMFEEIVRFHIMSERELREKNTGTGNEADSQLNFQQLTKALLTLLNLYGAVDAEGGSGWLHEAEFFSYYVLLNLGDRDHFKAEPLALWFRRVRPSVLEAPDFVYARKVLRCYRNDNYKGFFDLAQKATYLQGCLMELYFGPMRSLALKAINCGGYKLNPYPVAEIASLILMKQGDTEDLCKAHGLKTGIDKNHQLSLMAKQAPFTPSTQIFRHQCTLISRKRAPTFFQEIVGGRGEMER